MNSVNPAPLRNQFFVSVLNYLSKKFFNLLIEPFQTKVPLYRCLQISETLILILLNSFANIFDKGAITVVNYASIKKWAAALTTRIVRVQRPTFENSQLQKNCSLSSSSISLGANCKKKRNRSSFFQEQQWRSSLSKRVAGDGF